MKGHYTSECEITGPREDDLVEFLAVAVLSEQEAAILKPDGVFLVQVATEDERVYAALAAGFSDELGWQYTLLTEESLTVGHPDDDAIPIHGWLPLNSLFYPATIDMGTAERILLNA